MKAKRVATSWVTWLAGISAVAVVLPELIEAEYPEWGGLGAVTIGCLVAVIFIGKITYDKSTPVSNPRGTISDVELVPRPDGRNYFASTADFIQHLDSIEPETTSTPFEPHDTH